MRGKNRSAAFSAVETVVLSSILTLLALVLVPYHLNNRERHVANELAMEFRTYAACFREHKLVKGVWPQDSRMGQIPRGMEEDLPGFSNGTHRFGHWDWDRQVVGYAAGLSLVDPLCRRRVLERVDELMDDGSLSSGMMRLAGNRYIMILER